MTFCKVLAETEKNGRTVTAYELWEKNEAAPHYEIYISREGIAWDTYKTAKTTWRRKFRELEKQL